MTPISNLSARPFNYPKAQTALHCGKVSLQTLAKRYGTPLYVYSADQIVERLGLFQAALKRREHLVCYAVKANSALAILKLLAVHGAGFDIVSGGELERVMAVAPEAVERVVFSGVGKTSAEIDLALTRLITSGPRGMGELFKAFAVSDPRDTWRQLVDLCLGQSEARLQALDDGRGPLEF